MNIYARSVLVCHGTKRVPAADLVLRGRNHVNLMAGNPAFPDPQPSLAEVSKACDELNVASQVYEFNKGRVDLVTRNEARERLRRLIISLAAYVQACSDGDRTIAMKAGFKTKRKRSPSEPMDRPGNVRAKAAAFPGSIDLRWGGVKGHKMYGVWFTDDDPNREEG